VEAKTKRAEQKKAAVYIAALMLESLERFPTEERALRLKQIHEIASKIGPTKYGKFSRN
jgi:hypothetical protein